jgi:hypothetical protein
MNPYQRAVVVAIRFVAFIALVHLFFSVTVAIIAGGLGGLLSFAPVMLIQGFGTLVLYANAKFIALVLTVNLD